MLYSSGTKILCPLCVNRVAGLEATKIRVYKNLWSYTPMRSNSILLPYIYPIYSIHFRFLKKVGTIVKSKHTHVGFFSNSFYLKKNYKSHYVYSFVSCLLSLNVTHYPNAIP